MSQEEAETSQATLTARDQHPEVSTPRSAPRHSLRRRRCPHVPSCLVTDSPPTRHRLVTISSPTRHRLVTDSPPTHSSVPKGVGIWVGINVARLYGGVTDVAWRGVAWCAWSVLFSASRRVCPGSPHGPHQGRCPSPRSPGPAARPTAVARTVWNLGEWSQTACASSSGAHAPGFGSTWPGNGLRVASAPQMHPARGPAQHVPSR